MAWAMRLLERVCVICPGCWYARHYPDRKLAAPLSFVMRICPGCQESRAQESGGCCGALPEGADATGAPAAPS